MGRLKITQLCERCGEPFHPWPKRKNGNQRLYCSNDCRKTPIEQRFWSQVIKTETCWIWTGDKDKDGYGRIWCSDRRRSVRAHRVSWEIHNGPIPEGFDVLHHCDNPPCIRPEDLFLGTNADNTNDMVQKGRNPAGESHGMAKVNAGQVEEIRRRYRKGGITQQRLADEYGLNQTTISQMVLYRVWKQAV